MYCYALHLAPILLGPWLALAAQQSFLSDTLIRKGQVQNVLNHQPTTDVACRRASVRCRLVTHPTSDVLAAADGTHRDNFV